MGRGAGDRQTDRQRRTQRERQAETETDRQTETEREGGREREREKAAGESKTHHLIVISLLWSRVTRKVKTEGGQSSEVGGRQL